MIRTLYSSLFPHVRHLIPYLFFGALCSLLVNLPSFIAIGHGTFSLGTLGVQPKGSVDELYYAALIRKIADGYFSLGNASLFEYRFAVSVAGYAPLLQGVAMRLMHVPLSFIILCGDIIAPWIAGALLLSLTYRIEPQKWLAICGALMIFSLRGESWLRLISPQVTGIVFLLGIISFFSESRRNRIVRAGCTAILLLIQPVYAVFLLAAECLLMLTERQSLSWYACIQKRLFFIVIIAATVCLRFLLTYHGTDTLAVADTYRRLGLTPTHLPAAPLLQLKIVSVLLLHIFATHKNREKKRMDTIIFPVLLLASLAVLWQSTVTGVDGNFALYYTFPIYFILWMTLLRDATILIPLRYRRIILCIGAIIACMGLSSRMIETYRHPFASTAQIERSLATLFQNDTQTRIIAAPLEIANMIPALSQHFVLFSQYVRFQYARDEELGRRFVMQNALFPIDASILLLKGDPLVFGLYAGNLSAKKRTWCKIANALGWTKNPCNQQLEDYIYHQDVFRSIHDTKPELQKEMRAFHINSVVTDHPLPIALQPFCSFSRTADTYTLYDCNFDR